jgi:hypothetical protein
LNVVITVSPLESFPLLNGPHKLSWSYILDHIFADAFHARLAHLEIVLPSATLEKEVGLRASLTSKEVEEKGRGVALLSHISHENTELERVYSLTYGSLAPASFRRTSPHFFSLPPSFSASPSSQFSIFTWQASLWSLPIRCARLLRRPDLSDRAICAMRRTFTSETLTPAYYHLTTWHPKPALLIPPSLQNQSLQNQLLAPLPLTTQETW